MKIRSLFNTIMITLLTFGMANALTYFPGIIHDHSFFSKDGTQSPEDIKNRARDLELSFIFFTDHLKAIDKPKTLSYLHSNNDYGFDNYRLSVNSELKDPWPNLVSIAGAEVTAGKSHILVLNMPKSKWTMAPKSQEELLTELSGLAALPVAAHPSNQLYKFSFEETKIAGLCGIEMFNENDTAYHKTISEYVKLIGKGYSLFVTSGCDSHTLADPADLNRWQRITYLWAEKLGARELIEALRYGRTYASDNGCWLKSLNYKVGFVPQKVDRPSYDLVISFAKKTTSEKNLKIYRDGIGIPVLISILAKGSKEYRFQWTDKEATKGLHRYIIEVEHCLVTSPIILEVQQSPIVSKNDKVYGDQNWEEFKDILVTKDTSSDAFTNTISQKTDWNIKQPWPKSQSTFSAPVVLNIYVVYVYDGRPVADYPKNRILYYLWIFDDLGNRIYRSGTGFDNGNAPWENHFFLQRITLSKRGKYRIEIRDKTEKKIIAQKSFTIN